MEEPKRIESTVAVADDSVPKAIVVADHTESKAKSWADNVQAYVAVCNFAFLVLLSLFAFGKFILFERSLNRLVSTKTESEIALNTTPILVVTPTVTELASIGNDYRTLRLGINLKNAGNGTLPLENIKLETFSSRLPGNLEAKLIAAANEPRTNAIEKAQPTIDTVPELTAAATFDFKWTSVPELNRQIKISTVLLHDQEANLNFDYIVKLPTRPTWYRFTIHVAPPSGSVTPWEARTVDAVVELSHVQILPSHRSVYREYTYTVSVPSNRDSENVAMRPPRQSVVIPIPISGVVTDQN